MTDKPPRPPRLVAGPFVSVSGSVASLVALAIVLIDKVTASHQIDSQFVVWRLTLCLASLIAVGTIITLVYHFIVSALTEPNLTTPARTLRVAVLAVAGLFATAVFVDALFASIYWRWWLGGLVRIVYTQKRQEDTSPGPAAQTDRPLQLSKSVIGKTVNIFFADDRSNDALRAKSELEKIGASVGLIPKTPEAIQPNILYYRDVSMLEAALEIKSVLIPLGVTNCSVATWAKPSADVVVFLR